MKALSILILAFTLASCASQKEELAIEAEASETKVHDSKALGNSIHDLIAQSKTLSEAQKTQLGKIMEENKKKADTLTEKSFEFRSVLIKELLSGKVDQGKIDIIKADIKKIEDLRLKNTFDTVEKITAIVSDHPENQKFLPHILNMERITR